MVSKILMTRSAPQPRSKKTPSGGSRIANKILQISDPVKAMVKVENSHALLYTYTTEKDRYREFDLYYNNTSSGPVVCFVHGGAWRSEDKSDFSSLARSLCLQGFVVLVPNYRLTPHVTHPSHAQDILDCLTFFLSWQPPPGVDCGDRSRLYLIGHSCSAHMLGSIFLDSPLFVPSQQLLHSVQAIILSEGLYDLDLLLQKFPNYRQWFIEPAFGSHASYAEFSVTKLPPRTSAIKWLIIHSKGDTLVDMTQSLEMYRHLSSTQATQVVLNTQLDGEHDEILHSDAYIQIVSQFVLS